MFTWSPYHLNKQNIAKQILCNRLTAQLSDTAARHALFLLSLYNMCPLSASHVSEGNAIANYEKYDGLVKCLNKWWVLACEVWSVYIRLWAIFLAFQLQQLFGRNRNVSLTVLGLLFTEGVGNERKVWLILTIDVLVLLTLSKVEPGTTVMTLGNRLIRIYVNYNNCCLINNYDLLINDAPTYC